jgi:hypothetical protein
MGSKCISYCMHIVYMQVMVNYFRIVNSCRKDANFINALCLFFLKLSVDELS